MHQQHGVEAGICERHVVHVAHFESDVATAFQSPASCLNNPFADVQADDAAGPGSEQFRQHAVTGSDIQNVPGIEQMHQPAGGRLPGHGRSPTPPTCHAVCPGSGAAAVAQHLGNSLQVLLDQGVVAVAAQQLPQVVETRISDG